jgi:addiction module RelE/StbE family toxin
MWEIYEHRKVARVLNRLPEEVLQRSEKWQDIGGMSGPEGLRLIKGFNDERLSGEWKGHRSSRLNLQYRVIYKIDRENVYVQVEKVTPHDYRRS